MDKLNAKIDILIKMRYSIDAIADLADTDRKMIIKARDGIDLRQSTIRKINAAYDNAVATQSDILKTAKKLKGREQAVQNG